MRQLEDELQKVLKNHALWLKNEGGERANLRYANLSYADLRRADLTGANLTGATVAGVVYDDLSDVWCIVSRDRFFRWVEKQNQERGLL